MTQTTVFEVCLLSIKPGMEAEFEAGVRERLRHCSGAPKGA